MLDISLVVAFGAGLLSFLSPCVLPVAPVYLASLYGPDIYDGGARRLRLPIVLHSLSFIAGFSLVFVLLGIIAGITGYAVAPNFAFLNKLAGGLLIAFGIFMLASLKLPFLNFEKRLTPRLNSTSSHVRSFIIGATFCLGWTPCVAPVLGGILALASVHATAWQGAFLLAVYSLGLAVPFLIIGAAFDSIAPFLKRVRRYSIWISLGSALLLISVGILILTNRQMWILSVR